MSALPIILKQNSVSVGLFTRLRERELGEMSTPNGYRDPSGRAVRHGRPNIHLFHR
jgi:hypothetical protein